MSTQSTASRSAAIVRGDGVITSATVTAATSRMRSRQRRRSPSVKMPATRPCVVDDGRHAHALAAHLDDRLRQRRGRAATPAARRRVRITSATRVSKRRPSAPPGCDAREILGGETARIEQRQRQRVTQRQRRGRARRGRETERTRFGVDRRVEMHVGGLRQRTLLVAGEGDEARALALQMRRQRDQLVGFAGIRQHQHDVVGRDHPEVAVRRIGRMHEERGRSGGGQRGGELAADVARLADARDDDAAAAVEDHVDGGDERLAERADSAVIALGLGGEHVAGERRARAPDRRRARSAPTAGHVRAFTGQV